VAFQKRAILSIDFRLKLQFGKTRSQIRVLAISLGTIRVESCKKVIHSQGGIEHVHADDGWSIFDYAARRYPAALRS
jgi:hypothetical protein